MIHIDPKDFAEGFRVFQVRQLLDQQTSKERRYRNSHVACAIKDGCGYRAEVWSQSLRNGIPFRTVLLARFGTHSTAEDAIEQASHAMRHPRWREYVKTTMRQRPVQTTNAGALWGRADRARKYEALKRELRI